MKIRNGFVSNSSSSSFILAAKKQDSLSVTVEITMDITSLIDDIIYDKQDLIDYFDENWGTGEWQDDKYAKDQYDKCFYQLEAGNVILAGSVDNDYDEDGSSLFFYNNGFPEDNKDFTVIRNV